MWTCKQCGENVGETFDACWNCGADRAGNADPNFVKADDVPPKSAVKNGSALDPVSSERGCGFALVSVFGTIVLIVFMVNTPLLALLVVTNAMFAVLLGAILSALFKTGPARAFATGLFVGAVAYLVVVGWVLPSENDGQAFLVTSVILQGLYHWLVRSPMVISPESYAFMWAGQQFWAFAIGLGAGAILRRMVGSNRS